jgi:hypothetical protein
MMVVPHHFAPWVTRIAVPTDSTFGVLSQNSDLGPSSPSPIAAPHPSPSSLLAAAKDIRFRGLVAVPPASPVIGYASNPRGHEYHQRCVI